MERASGNQVLFAIGGLGRGGSELQLVRLLAHLGPQLVDSALLVYGPARDDLLRIVQDAGVRTVVVPQLRRGQSLQPLVTLTFVAITLLKLRPRVIYAWLEQSALLLVPWALVTRVPILVARRNVSGSKAEQAHPLLARAQRWLESRATLVTANSTAVADVARERGIRPDRIRVIRNGHASEPPLPLPDGETMVFGYLANFRPEKGHALLLDALELLPRTAPWRVLCAGRGPLRVKFVAELRRRDLEGRVEVLAVDDGREFWRMCHAAVLLSDHEGSPNALIEAAFAGRPIVSTAVGGAVEVVVDGGGILVWPPEAQTAAGALSSLIDADREVLERMGRRAWENAVERFSIAQMVDGHRNALQEASAMAGRLA
jgi:glycosyltransferase involved in cell wall biosynthesis